MDTDYLFYLICAAAFIIMLIYYIKRKHTILSILFGSCSGLASLIAVNYFGNELGVSLPLNLFNLCGSTVLGVPFVASIIVIRYI